MRPGWCGVAGVGALPSMHMCMYVTMWRGRLWVRFGYDQLLTIQLLSRLWVRFGYDPGSDPASYLYQMVLPPMKYVCVLPPSPPSPPSPTTSITNYLYLYHAPHPTPHTPHLTPHAPRPTPHAWHDTGDTARQGERAADRMRGREDERADRTPGPFRSRPRLHYRLLTLCPVPTDPVGQSWPRGTGSVGDSVGEGMM